MMNLVILLHAYVLSHLKLFRRGFSCHIYVLHVSSIHMFGTDSLQKKIIVDEIVD